MDILGFRGSVENFIGTTKNGCIGLGSVAPSNAYGVYLAPSIGGDQSEIVLDYELDSKIYQAMSALPYLEDDFDTNEGAYSPVAVNVNANKKTISFGCQFSDDFSDRGYGGFYVSKEGDIADNISKSSFFSGTTTDNDFYDALFALGWLSDVSV